MNQRKRIVLNSIINVSSICANGAFQVALVPILLIVLKESGLGILATIGVFYTCSRLIDVGFNSAINRYVPQHMVRNEMDQLNTVISTSVVYFAVVMVLIVIATIIVATNFVRWFNVSSDLVDAAVLGVYVTGLLLAVRMPLIPYKAVLSGMQRYDLLRLTEVGPRMFRCLTITALIWFFSRSSALIFVLVLNSVELVVSSVMHYRLARRLIPSLKVSASLARWACFRDMIGYSLSTFLYSVGTLIITQSSILIILRYRSDHEAGRYAIALYLIRFLNLLVVGLTQGIKPAVSKLEAEGKMEQVRQIFLQSSRYTNFVVLPACIGMAVASQLLLLAWVGPSKADLWPVVTILALGFGAFYSQYSSFFVMGGLKRHVFFGAMIITASVLGIILSIGFLQYTGWGLVGVALGSALPLLVGWVLVIPVYTSCSLGVPVGEYLRFAVLQPLFATIPLVLLGLAGVHWGIDHPVLTLIAVIGSGGIAFGISNWTLCLTESERLVCAKVLRQLRQGQLSLRGLASQLAK